MRFVLYHFQLQKKCFFDVPSSQWYNFRFPLMADFQHTSILLICHIFCRNPIFYRELVPTAIFWRVFRNFRLSCLTSQANCCPQLETLKCIEDATFIPVETKRSKLIITGCSVPTFDELLPGFRDVRISLHGWQYNEPSGACFSHLKLREWLCDIWNFSIHLNFLVVASAVGKSSIFG